MKKIFTILLAALLLLSAVSCGGTTEETGTPSNTLAENVSEPDVPQETVETSGYLCTFDNGTAIEMGAPADAVLGTLGDPLNVAEAPSCIHEGMDRIYTFGGYTLTTSPDGEGTDRIQEIALLSDAVMLEGGVSVGSTLDDAVKLFGSEYTEQFGVIQYTLDNVMISIILDGDSYITSLVIKANP